MLEIKELRIGESALLISFLRAKIGTEFNIANRLSKRFKGTSETALYYTCFGQYDLLEFQMVDSFKAVYNMPFDADILNSESSLFYSWQDWSIDIYEWAKGFPVLLLVLLKIQPSARWYYEFSIMVSIINRIRDLFGNHANMFASMGRDEVLLLLRGTNLSELLQGVSSLRRDLPVSIGTEETDTKSNEKSPIFIESMTFPLIAHPSLKGSEEYGQLEGEVRPLVTIDCHPGCEEVVLINRPLSCTGSNEVFGIHDIAFTWERPMNLSQFAKELTEFRQRLSLAEGISSTETTFLEEIKVGRKATPPSYHSEFNVVSIPDIEKIIEKAQMLEPMTKARLIEFFSRMNSYYRQQEQKSAVLDVLGIRYPIITHLEDFMKAKDTESKFIIENALSELVDLGNNAFYQRYAEFKPYLCRQLPFPFLRGINGYILAVSSIPSFVFSRVFPKLELQESWSGFVLFGLSYSYQLLKGRILSMPASTLQRPIEDWWGITHEIAHAIYWASDFYNKDLPPDIKGFLEGISTSSDRILLRVDIEEIYANWFDFKYIFQGDKHRYFPTIWRSWLRWERVLRFKEEYLLRSLIIYSTTDLDGLFESMNRSLDHTIEFLMSKFEEMKTIICTVVPEFNQFVSGVTTDDIKNMADFTLRMEFYYSFLEKKYYDPDIFQSLNPPYSEAALNNHIGCLKEGIIITDDIPSPIKLLHGLYDEFLVKDREVPLQTTAATVLSLWHKYIQDYGK